MYKLLVVEDSIDIQELLTIALAPIAELTLAGSIKTAYEIFKKDKFDLILMDVMLEDGNGFELTRMIRALPDGKRIPVIFLTSKNDISDKEAGFDLGAEDYIVKPCDLREVRLRIENRLKKIRAEKESYTGNQLQREHLCLNIPLQKVFIKNVEVPVTPLQFKILFYLMSHENQVIARDQLINEIWGKGVHVSRSIDTHVNSLRRKLGTYSSCIQAVYGTGYVFRSH